jgi:hypothetical protein
VPNQIIPTNAAPFYPETVTLDGSPYILGFAYNQRCACWYLTISTIDGTVVTAGLKLVCSWDILMRCASPLRPPGALIVVSTTTDLSPPGLLDLLPSSSGGTGRCYLGYIPAANVAALKAGQPTS